MDRVTLGNEILSKSLPLIADDCQVKARKFHIEAVLRTDLSKE